MNKKIVLGILGGLGVLAGILGYQGYRGNREYQVVGVIDGDTIKVQSLKLKVKSLMNNKQDDTLTIRYLGIDTPELAKGDQPEECFAQEAKKINEELVLGKKVGLEYGKDKLDQYNRTLAYIYVDKTMINEKLLKLGAGRFFPDEINHKYQEKLVMAGELAHREKKGLWLKCAPNSQGCIIKGNLDKLDKRWYHLPSFRHYSEIVINLNKGDRWFCTEEEAIKAGFERARE